MVSEVINGLATVQGNAKRSMFGTRWHEMLLILAVAAALTWPLQRAGGDFWFADQIFRWEGGHWALRDAWWTSTLLHTAGRQLGILLWLLLALAWGASRHGRISRTWQAPLAYLLTSLALTSLLISLLKRSSGVDCPWDLLRYGGEYAYLAPFSSFGAGTGACFPAAHAAVGYAWVALAFAMSHVRTRWRLLALAIALSIGIIFGITQQLRGAHFLSHDVWALTICWLVAALLARFWPWQKTVESSHHGARR